MGKQANKIVCLVIDRSEKSCRERFHGFVRFLSTKPKLTCRVVESGAREVWRNPALTELIRTCDAFVFGALPDAQALRAFTRVNHAPIVSIDLDKSFPGSLSVMIDNTTIGKMAKAFFARRGYRTTATVELFAAKETYHSKLRSAAFCADHAFTFTNMSPNCSDSAFQDWLKSLPKPCGIFAYNDRIAMETLSACRLARLRVPEQVAILGVDNETEICECGSPSISSIQPDFEFSGFLAGQLVDRILRGQRPPATLSYGVKALVERETTRSLKCGGRLIENARLIAREANGKTTEQSVAARLKVTPRLLRLRSNEILGHGFKEEIDIIRGAFACQVLSNHGLSISEVADRCGFPSQESFQHFFRRRFNATPLAFRHKMT